MPRLTFHASRFSTIAAAAVALSLTGVPASAHKAVQRFNQPQQLDAYGRLAVEASVITVMNCNGAGENGGQFYIYQYVNRAGFRAIKPPNWGQALGGRDWATYEQAAAVACGTSTGAVSVPTGPGVTGRWKMTTNCSWTNPAWGPTVQLTQAANGALSAVLSDDPLKAETAPKGTAGSTMVSQVSGSTFNLLLHPTGWISVLEFTGTVNGSRIDGRIHHYTTDDCNFTMVRQ